MGSGFDEVARQVHALGFTGGELRWPSKCVMGQVSGIPRGG